MRWGWRALVAVVAVLTVAGMNAVGAAPLRRGSKLDPLKPCKYLTTKQVQKAFGGPVTVDPTNQGRNTFLANACAFIVGPSAQPSGVLVVVNRFPYFAPPGQTAIDVLEATRATDSISGLTVEDGKLGKGSYVNVDRSILAVAPNTKFAFSLQWLERGVPPEGGTLATTTRKQLTTLAKLIVSRAR